DIALHTPHHKVKQILQDRTDRHRTRLPVQDSSPATAERRANLSEPLSNEQEVGSRMCGIALSIGPEADPHLSPDARRPRPARRDHNARDLVGAAKWNAARWSAGWSARAAPAVATRRRCPAEHWNGDARSDRRQHPVPGRARLGS
ncbi:hypothetical protein, partial [Micromonospora sp. ATA51]